MRTAIKHILGRTYKPLLERYLSSLRTYCQEGIRLEIPPQVFHPGFFSSTRLLLDQVKKLKLPGAGFLEPGCGSGLISIYAAQKGAGVTASDINPIAIEYLQMNSGKNQVQLSTIRSDLFDNIPPQRFDIIAINPPYYKNDPLTEKDYAWFCGAHGEYFTKLFRQLSDYIHEKTEIMMVLCDGCDMEGIHREARDHGFQMNCIMKKNSLLEYHYIFRISAIT